jgi:hypothetical protein
MLGAIFHVTTGGGTCKISSYNHWKSHIDHTEIENEFFSKTWLAMNEKVVYKKILGCIKTAFIRDLGRCLDNTKDM